MVNMSVHDPQTLGIVLKDHSQLVGIVTTTLEQEKFEYIIRNKVGYFEEIPNAG